MGRHQGRLMMRQDWQCSAATFVPASYILSTLAVGIFRGPVLLKFMAIQHLDQVWCVDHPSVPVPRRGSLFLVATQGRARRRATVWRLSNTLDNRFSVELAGYGTQAECVADLPARFSSAACTWQVAGFSWLARVLH